MTSINSRPDSADSVLLANTIADAGFVSTGCDIAAMYDNTVRHGALALIDQGFSLRAVSMTTGINRATLRSWRDSPGESARLRADCPRCAHDPSLPEPQTDYAYLLGLYLGDGYISRTGAREKNVWALRIICADAWPGLLEECKQAMHALRPDNKVLSTHKQGCTEVFSSSKHWPCLFPQHAAGKKHERKIELVPWQLAIVQEYPGKFVRGLFHSDGWRGVNRVRARLAHEGLGGLALLSTVAAASTSGYDAYRRSGQAVGASR
jgi:hypothetical protein